MMNSWMVKGAPEYFPRYCVATSQTLIQLAGCSEEFRGRHNPERRALDPGARQDRLLAAASIGQDARSPNSPSLRLAAFGTQFVHASRCSSVQASPRAHAQASVKCQLPLPPPSLIFSSRLSFRLQLQSLLVLT